jgi:hypothetical protein
MHAWMPCRLMSGHAHELRDEDLPRLPEWFPLPARDDDGNEITHTSEQRAALRRAHARSEALQGPFDGRREQIRRNPDGSPPDSIVMLDGSCLYVLDEQQTTKECAVYRYSPQLSLMHKRAMQAVEDGFHEYGQNYALEARNDDATQLGR